MTFAPSLRPDGDQRGMLALTGLSVNQRRTRAPDRSLVRYALTHRINP
jgi:hypothetical protein